MRSRCRTHMFQKRRLITTRIQWAIIGLISLIALNTTLYWSLNQNIVVPPPDTDVSDFPIRQKVISIDDNWGDTGEPHWEVIDPVEEILVKPAMQEQTGKEVAHSKKSLAAKTNNNEYKKKQVTTDRPNVRYITLKSSVQAKNQNQNRFSRKQNDSVKAMKPDTPQPKQTVNLQKPMFETQAPIKTTANGKAAFASNPKLHVNLKHNKAKESKPVIAQITYHHENTSSARGGILKKLSRASPRASVPTFRPHSTKLPPASGTGNIRYYSKPPWFSNEDIQTLRLLSEEKIRDVRNLPSTFGDQRKAVLFRVPERIFESGANQRHGDLRSFLGKCKSRDACAMVLPGNHIHEVLAFHVDRIFGFNRSLPCVARSLPDDFRMSAVHGNVRGTIYPMTQFDAGVHMAQDVLFWSKDKFQRCAKKGDVIYTSQECEGVLPDEISGMAIFDFLLQITNRLDRYCCGLALSDRPMSCGQLQFRSEPGTCGPSDHLLGRIYRRGTSYDRRLVFTPNVVNLNVPSGRLDYLLLDGIDSFPEYALSILRTGKFRQMLLQSLFIDKVYWDGLGGRKAIEDILEVMDRRGKMLLKYVTERRARKRSS